jgi:hypothetical protein
MHVATVRAVRDYLRILKKNSRPPAALMLTLMNAGGCRFSGQMHGFRPDSILLPETVIEDFSCDPFL